jgi:GNAT superfamily N-acetyltransferase
MTISIYAGGPGSGCNPAAGRCGRREGGEQKVAQYLKSLSRKGFRSELRKNIQEIDSETLIWPGEAHKVVAFFRGERVGKAGISEKDTPNGKVWTILLMRAKESLVGKGFGKYIYGAVLQQAVKQGVSVVQSENKGWRSKGAEHAWDLLSKEVPVYSIGKGRTQRWQVRLRG